MKKLKISPSDPRFTAVISNLKLGKEPKKSDPRNIQLKNILTALPPLPILGYDVDKSLPGPIPMPMFGNDSWGDCVIAGRAHETLRFEDYEQKIILTIPDSDVLNEYWKEGGETPSNPHPDNGLVMLTSLNEWRKTGWSTAGNVYTIYAYAEIQPLYNKLVKYAIYLLRGCYAGVQLPIDAQYQIVNHLPWTVTKGPNSEPGSWGGHCIYIVAYNCMGPVCVTWGQRQQMTWAWWNKYCEECYAIVQSKEPFVANSPVNIALLDSYLNQI